MKKLLSIFLILCMLLLLTACAQKESAPDNSSSQPSSSDTGLEPIGDDWHTWGMYEFATVGDVKIAIEKAYNDDNQIVGYNIYADGTSRGELLCEIRCDDVNYLPEEFDCKSPLIFEDYNGDSLTDIGAPLRSGEVIWYTRYGSDTAGFDLYELSDVESYIDWHDWGVFEFKGFDDGMTIAIATTGESGKEVGFNVFADLGPEVGSDLCNIRFADGGYTLADFDLKDCIVLNDYNSDGLGDIGVKTTNGNIMWYLRDNSRRFNYTETQTAE